MLPGNFFSDPDLSMALGLLCSESLFQASQHTSLCTHRQVTSQVPGAQRGAEVWKATREGFLESLHSVTLEKRQERNVCVQHCRAFQLSSLLGGEEQGRDRT